LMQLACMHSAFPVLHFWPTPEDEFANYTAEQRRKTQSAMLSGIARDELIIPGKKNNAVRPFFREILKDFDQLLFDPFIKAWERPVDDLCRKAWELRARGSPKTREDVTAWARMAADYLVEKAKLYDGLLACGKLPETVIDPAKNCGRLKPDGDLYRIANPGDFAEVERVERAANLPTHEERLKPQGNMTDLCREIELEEFRKAASTATVTEAHIGAGLQAAFVRYLKPRVTPKKLAPPMKD
jgi:hypothetical protein